MTEVNFFQSWAFAFIAGCFVGGLIVFIVTIIVAAGSRRSRAEERIEATRRVDARRRSDSAIYEATERERMRRGEYQLVGIKIATQGKPEDA